MADQEDKKTGAGGFLDILTMWGIVPAALIAGHETGALDMLGKLIKKFYEQGKEVYRTNMNAFKMGSIKTIRIVHFVLTGALFFLAGLLATLLLTHVIADSAAATSGIIVFLVLAIGNLLYVALVVPPVPEFVKKTGVPALDGDSEFDDEGIKLHPDTRVDEAGETVPNEIAGKRVLAHPEQVKLSRVSVLATMVILAVCGYIVTAMLYMIGGYGESRIPAMIGTIVLVLTSAGLRSLVALIAWAIKRTGMFIESLAGTFRLHTLALMAGHTYKDLDKGPMELFNEDFLWPAFVKRITSLEIGLLVMGFFMTVNPTSNTFNVIGIFVVLAWLGMLMLGRIGKDDVARQMTEATVMFIAKRARIVAMAIIALGVFLPAQVKQAGSGIVDTVNAVFTAVFGFFGLIGKLVTDPCRFINTTDLAVDLGVLVVAGATLYGLVKIVLGIHSLRKKEEDDDKYRKTEIGVLVLVGLNVIVVGFALVSTFAAVKVDSAICRNETKSSTAQVEPSKEIAKPLASAQPTSAPAEQMAVNEDSSTDDSVKPAEPEVHPLTALEQENLELKKKLADVNRVILSQNVPVRAPQVRAPSPTPPSAPAVAQTGKPAGTTVASKSSLDDEAFDRIAKQRGW